MRLGFSELLVILAIFMLLFGAKRLPDLAEGMGKAIRNFKRGMTDLDDDVTPADKQVSSGSGASELKQPAEATPAERKS